MTYIYALIDPTTHEIRYIGKSNNPSGRLNRHIKESLYGHNNHRHRWIRKLLSNNLKPELIILDECDEKDWQIVEQAWICYGFDNNWPLVNSTFGGDGLQGYSFSEECKAKLRIIQKEIHSSVEYRKKIGAKVRERYLNVEERKKISDRMKGKNNPMYGRCGELAPMFGRKGKLAPNYGRIDSEETRKRRSESHKGLKHSAEHTENIRKARRLNKLKKLRLNVEDI